MLALNELVWDQLKQRNLSISLLPKELGLAVSEIKFSVCYISCIISSFSKYQKF